MQSHSNRVRIIGGVWRSRQIAVLQQEGLRPSSDRVRETLFNWLGQDLSGLKVLDVFAGSGALGFESASRGANQIVLIEKEKRTFKQLQAQYQQLISYPITGHLEIIEGDGLAYMRQLDKDSYHLVLLDPPFSQPEVLKAAVIEAGRICDDQFGGGIYIESSITQELSELEKLLVGWTCLRQMQTAQTRAALFRRTSG